MKRRTEGLVSVVVAVYNEQACLRELYRRIDEALAGAEFELLLVDDGSTDGSFAVIEALAERDPRVIGVALSRNEGHQPALMCGMDHARGDVCITLDADLQHPPEHIPAMLDAWRAGFDVVNMVRRPSARLTLRDALAAMFYRLFNRIADVRVSAGSTDFRLLDHRCVDALRSMRERLRFLRGMVRRIGFRQIDLEFDAPPRFAGATSYTLPKLWSLALDAIFSFSAVPLALPLIAGVLALAGAGVALAAALGRSPPASSAATWTLILVIALLFSLSFLSLGILGAYLARLIVEVKGRPLYFVERRTSPSRGIAARRPAEQGPRDAHRHSSDPSRLH